jgi:CubicO group peptidase (beta-lactamase class C family)
MPRVSNRPTAHALLALAWVACLAGGARAEPPRDAPAPTSAAELDRRIADAFARHQVPGASVVVVEDGQVALSKGYGVADVRAKAAVTRDTLFRAGSISKSITSIAVMLLVQEGKLRLDAKLAELAPEIPFDNPWEATDPVRLVQLLEHTSGFGDLRFRQFAMDGDMPLARAVEANGPYRCRWRPGTYFAYNNGGPVIAAYVVEKVTGQTFAEFTRARIFGPLGMASARWDRPSDPALLARSYAADGSGEVPYADIPSKPAGALNVTADDLAKLVAMFDSRGAYDGGTLLRPDSVARIETATTSLAVRSGLRNGYGLGNLVTATPRALWHGHNGSIDGFLAEYRYAPEHRAGVVVMINTPKVEALGEAMDAGVAYLERAWPELPKVTPVPLPRADLERFAGSYFSTAFDQDWQPALDLKIPLRVTVDGDGLDIGGKHAVPVAPAVFAEPGSATPRWAFAQGDEGTVILKSASAGRRVSPVAAGVRLGVWYGLAPAALLGTLVALPIWLVAAVRRKVRGLAAWSVRLLPALAVAALPVLVVTFVKGVGPLDPSADLGRVSALSLEVFGLSCLLPALTLAALAVVWRYGAEAPRAARVLAWINVAMAVAASVHFAMGGWVGLRTWALP